MDDRKINIVEKYFIIIDILSENFTTAQIFIFVFAFEVAFATPIINERIDLYRLIVIKVSENSWINAARANRRMISSY